MKSNLGQLDFKSNGIGFLRILFASIVVWSHGWHMAGFGLDPLLAYSHGIFSSGYLAVGGFFVLSGFLITRSGKTTSGPARFLWHRVLRIYPGFWVCLFVTAFALAPIIYAFEAGSLHGFLTISDGPLSYIYRNATLIIGQRKIGNLMAAFPFAEQMNASLWTLAWEFICYLSIGLLGAFTIYRFPKLSLFAVALAFVALFYFEMMVYHSIFKGFIPTLGLLIMFWLGSAGYLFRDCIPIHWALATAATVITVTALPTPLCQEIVPFSAAYLALYAAMHVPVRSFDRRVNLSYGLYLYAMPIEKIETLFGINRYGMAAYFVCAMFFGLAFAAASWFLIEKPALSLRALRLPAGFSDVGTPA